MSPYAFLGLCVLGAILVVFAALAVLSHVIHECPECDLPDRHGDYPAIPEELIEKARAEAAIRDMERVP